MTYKNPYEDLSLQEIYDGLMSGRFGPRWPEEKLQMGYAGTKGVDLLRRAFQFIDMLDKDGAFKPGWKGLDYGCGWGRFPSVLLSKGPPDQLDLCDAWLHTLNILGNGKFTNKVFRVPELLSSGDLTTQTYDFILSFSVFTHLNPQAFDHNIPVLRKALRPNGNLYITVRHDDFIDHFYKKQESEMRTILNRDGILFTSSDGQLDADKTFGHATVTREYMKGLGGRYLGQPHSLQHVYAFSAS